MEQIIELVERKLKYAQTVGSQTIARTMYDQAFGAVEYYLTITWQDNPEAEKAMLNRWNEEYRDKFEEAVYGKTGQ